MCILRTEYFSTYMRRMLLHAPGCWGTMAEQTMYARGRKGGKGHPSPEKGDGRECVIRAYPGLPRLTQAYPARLIVAACPPCSAHQPRNHAMLHSHRHPPTSTRVILPGLSLAASLFSFFVFAAHSCSYQPIGCQSAFPNGVIPFQLRNLALEA